MHDLSRAQAAAAAAMLFAVSSPSTAYASASAAPADGPQPVAQCDGRDTYSVSSKTDTWHHVDTNSLTNDGALVADLALALSGSGTVTLSQSGTVKVDASAIVAGVEASGTVGAQVSMSGSRTVTVTVHVRPGHTGYAGLGFRQSRTVGKAGKLDRYRCSYKYATVTATTPYRFGTHTWGG